MSARKVTVQKFGILVFSALLLISPHTTSAQTMSELQARLNEILAQIEILRANSSIDNALQTSNGTIATPYSAAHKSENECPVLSLNMSLNTTDGEVGGEVTKLQRYLAQFRDIYPEARITGFFGPATERAVKRWQERYGVVSSGSSETTGYGSVGPRTRASLRTFCESGAAPGTNHEPSVPSTTYAQSSYTKTPVSPGLSGRGDIRLTSIEIYDPLGPALRANAGLLKLAEFTLTAGSDQGVLWSGWQFKLRTPFRSENKAFLRRPPLVLIQGTEYGTEVVGDAHRVVLGSGIMIKAGDSIHVVVYGNVNDIEEAIVELRSDFVDMTFRGVATGEILTPVTTESNRSPYLYWSGRMTVKGK